MFMVSSHFFFHFARQQIEHREEIWGGKKEGVEGKQMAFYHDSIKSLFLLQGERFDSVRVMEY